MDGDSTNYTEKDREELTDALIEDLVYRTAMLTPKLRQHYINRFREIWRNDLDTGEESL